MHFTLQGFRATISFSNINYHDSLLLIRNEQVKIDSWVMKKEKIHTDDFQRVSTRFLDEKYCWRINLLIPYEQFGKIVAAFIYLIHIIN